MKPNESHAYIAGMIDADGTIGIRKFKNSTGQTHYRPMVEVTNMSTEIMSFLTKTFGGSSCYTRSRKYKSGGIYTWRVNGSKCLPVLQAVLPYLVFKGPQARNCLELVSRIGPRGNKWSDAKRKTETAVRHKLYMKAKSLNHH